MVQRIGFLFICLSIAACTPSEMMTEQGDGISTYQKSGIYRVIDYEAQIVCYKNSSGIDCMPLSETALETSPENN